MTSIKRLAFIGNSLPRRCGIATFTTDLRQAVATFQPDVDACIVAMTNRGHTYKYPPVVRIEIKDDRLQDYVDAAAALNGGQFDAVSLQHEFGIFGGEAGSHIVALLSRLNMPIISTLHTILAEPTPAQRDVLNRIIELSSRVIVMANKGRDLLRTIYRVPAEKIEVIPHGIPDIPLVGSSPAKEKLGFGGRSVILTFGLLSPNKGIEVMIDAMPAILSRHPNTVYVVLGATHPNLVQDEGEAYREDLVARARERGVEESVVFLDQFVDQATLLDFISMCDVYVTPYLSEAQMTSGTLAYSFGCGKPIVSTPYWHAQELLADGRGTIVPFGDATAIGQATADLLCDGVRRQAMGEQAYTASRPMTWACSADRYLKVFETAVPGQKFRVIPGTGSTASARDSKALPELQTSHFLAMCDDTGLFQHAVYSVPDRSHGYCIDDNARALLLSCALDHPREQGFPESVSSRFASFIQHAWNPDTKRFRNFMGFDRRWLEDRGSEDSQGRALWAVGECARGDADEARRGWARWLFIEAMPTALTFGSPRAWAFALLGLNAYCAVAEDKAEADRLRRLLSERLMSVFKAVATPDWLWFEEGLAYDNARLPQALIECGLATRNAAQIEVGLTSLRWLMMQQTTKAGLFRPVGTAGFQDTRKPPEMFDQQPIEASATISACLAAWRADGDDAWTADAASAFAWFRGANDLSTSLIDDSTGACRDGLHPDRPNENRGGESVVSYLLSLAEMRELARSTQAFENPLSVQVLRA